MSNARNIARLSPNVNGQISDSNILGISSSKLVGQVPDSNAPSGSIIQVVSSATSTQVSTSSLDWQNSNLSVSITPLFSSSRILILVNDRARGDTPSNYHECWFEYGIFRDGVSTALSELVVGWGTSPTTYNKFAYENVNMKFLDSPNTTNSVTYRTRFKTDIITSGTTYVHSNAVYTGSIEGVCQIIAMEIMT